MLLKFLRKKRANSMNSADVAVIVGELLPVATSLVNIIEKIRVNSPDAWAQVSTQYADAVSAWYAAKPDVVSPVNAQQIAQDASEIVSDIISTPTPETPMPVTVTAVQKPDPQFNAHLSG